MVMVILIILNCLISRLVLLAVNRKVLLLFRVVMLVRVPGFRVVRRRKKRLMTLILLTFNVISR